MLEKFQSLPPEKQTENMASAFGDRMDQMVNYVYDHYDNFKLLLRCSDNGKYGDMIHNLVDSKTFEFTCISADDIQDLGMADWREEDMKKRIIDKISDELEAAEVKIADDTFDELVKKFQ